MGMIIPAGDRSAASSGMAAPDAKVAANGLRTVTDHYERFARQLPEQPILIGHSFGGLMTQLLLNRGVGAAGVAIQSGPPQFLLSTKWSFIRSVWPGLGFFTDVNKTNLMSFAEWQYTFTNGRPLVEQQQGYEALVIPESKRLFREALTDAARVDYAKPHAPLLFTAGSEDHIVPASMNRKNVSKYTHKGSITEYKEFAGRTHSVLNQPGWEEVAEYVHGWITR